MRFTPLRPARLGMVAASVLLCIVLGAPTAFGRLGENIGQCQERYGAPSRVIPGSNGIYQVGVYQKSGLEIITVFVGADSNSAKVGMILYNKEPRSASGIPFNHMQSDEETTLLATVSGKWESYTPPPTLSVGRGIKPMTAQPSLVEKRRAESLQGVNGVISILYPPLTLTARTADLLHNGNTLFAFRIAGGMALVSYDAVAPIQRWSEAARLERELAKRPPPRKMDGL